MLAILLAIHATYCKAGDKQGFDKRFTSFCDYFRFFTLHLELSLPVMAAFANRERMVKIWSEVVVAAAVVKVVMVAARTEVVAAAGVVLMFSPLTLNRLFTTVLIHFILKVVFSDNKKRIKN